MANKPVPRLCSRPTCTMPAVGERNGKPVCKWHTEEGEAESERAYRKATAELGLLSLMGGVVCPPDLMTRRPEPNDE